MACKVREGTHLYPCACIEKLSIVDLVRQKNAHIHVHVHTHRSGLVFHTIGLYPVLLGVIQHSWCFFDCADHFRAQSHPCYGRLSRLTCIAQTRLARTKSRQLVHRLAFTRAAGASQITQNMEKKEAHI
eukprot:scaffold95246_cov22-Tisochrysis_lutea.AAC.1